MNNHKNFDVIIIGAGAAGLMCALSASLKGRKVAIIDHKTPGKKILISGGGRCNFTNLYVEADNYLSNNPHFFKSALSRYSQYDFMALLDKNQIQYQEKKLGQLFCSGKAKEILELLLLQCQELRVNFFSECLVEKITHVKKENPYVIKTSQGVLKSNSLVVATGGLSIPKMGATDLGFKIAKQFNINIIDPLPALVPLCLEPHVLKHTKQLAGISVDSHVQCNNRVFRENILFTHKGLSGPAILQISSYWKSGQKITIDLLPDTDLEKQLLVWQQNRPKAELKTLLSTLLSKRLISLWFDAFLGTKMLTNKAMNQYTKDEMILIATLFQKWTFIPSGTEGYRVAEVTKGGVDCNELSSKTFESKKISGLYFIGEVVDVTGWLGGYNFQWAWSSGHCAGLYV